MSALAYSLLAGGVTAGLCWVLQSSPNHYDEHTMLQTKFVTERDVREVEDAALAVEARDIPSIRALLTKGFAPNDIHVEERVVQCRSNHGLVMTQLMRAHPLLDVESRVQKYRETDEFSSAYDSDTYVTDTWWPVLCVRVSPEKVSHAQ
jgi:hypothetical protein